MNSSPRSGLPLPAALMVVFGPLILLWVLPLTYFLLVLLGQFGILTLLGRLARLMPTVQGRAPEGPPPPVKVSVIIPARNERRDLALCLDDLRAQDWVRSGGSMEVLVVDGRSTDGTGAMAREHPLRPTVLDEPPIPRGWVGKNWACHQGSKQAMGDLLLFVDADVRLAPEAVRTSVERQGDTKADLVAFGAEVVAEGFWEKVVMPVYVQIILLYFMLVRVDPTSSVPDMANGQFMCFSRAGYERCGGHESVRGSLLEDVRLAQEVRRKGGTVRMFAAPALLRTRMYVGRTEMAEGIRKSFQGSDLTAGRQARVGMLIVLLFLAPILFLLLGAFGLLPSLWALLSVVIIAFTALKQVALQRPLGGTPAYGLLYPLGCAFLAMTFFESAWGRSVGGKVLWKDREYAT